MHDLIPLFKHLLRILQADPITAKRIPELRGITLRTLFWLTLTEFAMVMQLYPVKLFVDILGSDQNRLALFGAALLMLAINLIANILHRHMDNYRNTMTWMVWSLLWGYGHRHHLRLSTDWHVAHSTGEKDSILGKNLHRVEVLIDEYVFTVFPGAIQALFLCVGMWLLGWEFGLVAFGTLAGYGIIVMFTERALAPLREGFRKQMKRIERDGTELIRNWRTIKQFGIEDDQSDEHDTFLEEFRKDELWRHDAFLRYIKRQDDFLALTYFALYAILAIPFFPLTSVGTIALAGSWMQRIYSVARMFHQFQQRMNEGIIAFKELIKILETVPSVQSKEGAREVDSLLGGVEFRNISFSYPSGKKGALRNVSFSVEPNKTIALVGRSGSGKSTVASLLMREYDPNEGAILIDGIDLREFDYTNWRKNVVAIVSQDVQLFDVNVRDNIRIGRPDAPKGAEEEATRLAYADEFIHDLPKGYETMIGEDGIRLSGGQRQRLAIARALMKKPRILILDEATSSLDALSQEKVQKAIDGIIGARQATLFVIAHRFSTIMRADLVLVLEDGHVAEFGTHEELLRQNGMYRRLRELELRGMLEENIDIEKSTLL